MALIFLEEPVSFKCHQTPHTDYASNTCTRRQKSSHIHLDLVLLVGLGILFSTVISLASSSKVCVPSVDTCGEGSCVNGTCVCNPGWRGAHCDVCYGRVRLKPGLEGIIHDGQGNYSANLACSWLLDAGSEGRRVTFDINSFSTECVWDHLYFHDGDSTFSPLVFVYSGVFNKKSSIPSFKFDLSGRYAFVHFYSDAAFISSGFNISYKIDDCALECSKHGVCNNSVCECLPGWKGDNCDVLDEGCPYNCSQHGVCVGGKCQCNDGYRGPHCASVEGELYVEQLKVASANPPVRASAAMVYYGMDDLWLFGGYRMGNESTQDNIWKFTLSSDSWSVVEEQASTPWPRYEHTVVLYNGMFYLFGGVSKSEIKSDFWSFSPATKEWIELKHGLRDLSGHTAHVVGDTMLIIFGYSSKYGYSSRVMEYNFVSENWTMVKTVGSAVRGGYGHASVYDSTTGMIYVYGGYHSNTPTTYNLTDRMYRYDTLSKSWFILASSGTPRYLHTAALLNGLVFTFGGSLHNDTRLDKQAKCFSSDVMVYDISCNSWHVVPSQGLKLMKNSDTMGHSMVTINEEAYMFGGFNSALKNDLLRISAGNCTFLKTEEKCNLAFPGMKCVWTGDVCQAASGTASTCDKLDPNQACSGYNTCQGCLSNPGCHLCGDRCVATALSNINCTKDVSKCTKPNDSYCKVLKNCMDCLDDDRCFWMKECREKQAKDVYGPLQDICQAKKACSAHTNCGNCTSAECMWCSNQNRCIDTNSYVVAYHYGQCMDWTTFTSSCNESECSHYKSCSECQSVPKCGWCNDESNTGAGTCHDGSMAGPVVRSQGAHTVQPALCSAGKTWHFNDCPKCQCNGHSTCYNGTDVCIACTPPITGPQCQYCSSGFYSSPKNGGTCKPCSCNNQADSCDPTTGACYCRTRGVIGHNCDSCDTKKNYTGNPKNGGTCSYQLATDYQYTFDMNEDKDMNATSINFMNTPLYSDKDVDFTLNCSGPALLNITYKSTLFPIETEYISGRKCDYFRTKFEHKNHAFGGKENTTFMVYVYDFKAPFKLQISFVQPKKLNFYKFFIYLFCCFLALILIMAAAWKIKHKVQSYRRGRRLEVEMQQMARRPFSTIAVEIEKKSSPAVVDKRDHLDSVLRRRKKPAGNKPSSIAIEPLKDNKAAILTLLIQLPTGNSDYAPNGHSGLAVGSALVSLGSNRKQSLEHIRGDKVKVRKNLSLNHPDACA